GGGGRRDGRGGGPPDGIRRRRESRQSRRAGRCRTIAGHEDGQRATLTVRYARSGDVHVAYQTVGSEKRDLLVILGTSSRWRRSGRSRRVPRSSKVCPRSAGSS